MPSRGRHVSARSARLTDASRCACLLAFTRPCCAACQIRARATIQDYGPSKRTRCDPAAVLEERTQPHGGLRRTKARDARRAGCSVEGGRKHMGTAGLGLRRTRAWLSCGAPATAHTGGPLLVRIGWKAHRIVGCHQLLHCCCNVRRCVCQSWRWCRRRKHLGAMPVLHAGSAATVCRCSVPQFRQECSLFGEGVLRRPRT